MGRKSILTIDVAVPGVRHPLRGAGADGSGSFPQEGGRGR